MAAEKRFAVQVGGLEFDLASFPDMPEEVRQYLDEIGRQLEENGAEGRNRIGGVMPQYVDDWIRASVIDLQKRVDKEGPDAVKVESMDRDWYAGYVDKTVIKTLAQIDAATGGTAHAGAGEDGGSALRGLADADQGGRGLARSRIGAGGEAVPRRGHRGAAADGRHGARGGGRP